jgi:uncharacterized protein (DUF924 family)
MMAESGRILIDDLEGAPAAPQAPAAGPAMPVTGEREDWLKRYNAPPAAVEFTDQDPYSPAYTRFDVDETPGSILYFWFAYSADRASVLVDRMSLWFGGGFELDRIIAHRFSSVVAKLASGAAYRWAAQGPRERLAAVIALDQFTRSIFRNTPAAFENDALALKLAKDGVAAGEDMQLKPVERWFLYMPLEHSESSTDQRRSLDKFSELLSQATPELRPHLASAYDYAKRHAKVIQRFGRFPHRNAVLGRMTTSAEKTFLKRTPGGF